MLEGSCRGTDRAISSAEESRFAVEAEDWAALRSRLVSRRVFPTESVIAGIPSHRILTQPTLHSIQIGLERHIDDIGALAYLNHSCDPNVFIDVDCLMLRALKDIAIGDELTLFYPATEWEMAQPFQCSCGAEECLGWIGGAKYLSPRLLARHVLSPHIARLAGLLCTGGQGL